jgi:hypothetical protein
MMIFANSSRDFRVVRESRGAWWGEPKGFHLDCWGEVNQAAATNATATATTRIEGHFIVTSLHRKHTHYRCSF